MNVFKKNVSVPTGSLGHKCPFAVSTGMGSQGDGREREERAGSGTTWKEQGKDRKEKGRGEVEEEVKSDGQRDAEMAGYGKLPPPPPPREICMWCGGLWPALLSQGFWNNTFPRRPSHGGCRLGPRAGYRPGPSACRALECLEWILGRGGGWTGGWGAVLHTVPSRLLLPPIQPY